RPTPHPVSSSVNLLDLQEKQYGQHGIWRPAASERAAVGNSGVSHRDWLVRRLSRLLALADKGLPLQQRTSGRTGGVHPQRIDNSDLRGCALRDPAIAAGKTESPSAARHESGP